MKKISKSGSEKWLDSDEDSPIIMQTRQWLEEESSHCFYYILAIIYQYDIRFHLLLAHIEFRYLLGLAIQQC